MHLSDFLAQTGTTQTAFARDVGVSGVAVHRWVTRKSLPSWDKVARIEVVTGGQVLAADWVPRDESKAA